MTYLLACLASVGFWLLYLVLGDKSVLVGHFCLRLRYFNILTNIIYLLTLTPGERVRSTLWPVVARAENFEGIPNSCPDKHRGGVPRVGYECAYHPDK